MYCPFLTVAAAVFPVIAADTVYLVLELWCIPVKLVYFFVVVLPVIFGCLFLL